MTSAGNSQGNQRPPGWFGYVATIVIEAGLTGFLLLVQRVFPLPDFPIPYVLIIMLVAYLFGGGPAILAFVVGLFAFDYFFVPPLHSLIPHAENAAGWAAITAYLIGSSIVGFATVLVRRAKMRVERIAEDLQVTNESLATTNEELACTNEELEVTSEELRREIEDRKKVEESLRQRSEELQTVMDTAPVAIFITHDPETRSITGNKSAQEMVELPPGENISKSAPPGERPTKWQEMRDGVPIQPKDLPMQQAVAGKEIRDYEMDLVFEDGTVKSVIGNAAPIRDENGNPQGGVLALIDITGRKQAEERERRLEREQVEFYRRTISAATSGRLIITDPQEILQAAGPKVAEWDILGPQDIKTVRKGVEETAGAAGIEDPRLGELVVAVGEAATNAVKHAGGGRASFHRSDDVVTVVVSDRGAGIPALSLPDVALRPGYSTAGTLGMGYKVMIQFADRVLLATGPEGTVVALEMRIHPSKHRAEESLMERLTGGIV